MAASRYRIVLRGRLSERFESAFDGMTLEHGPNRTVLIGDIRDQAQLYGLIGRLQEFGIELLALEPADGSAGGGEPGAGPVVCGLPARQPVRLKGVAPARIVHRAIPFARRMQLRAGITLPRRHQDLAVILDSHITPESQPNWPFRLSPAISRALLSR